MRHILNDSLRTLALPLRSPLGPGLGVCSVSFSSPVQRGLLRRIQSGPESLVVGTEVGAPAMFMSSLSGGGCGDLSETQVGEGACGGLGSLGLWGEKM